MAYNPHSPVVISPVPAYYQGISTEQPWMHLLTKIPSHVAAKLNIIGVFYIILGLIAIGLDVGGFLHGLISFGGFINGIYIFIVGILFLYLGRHQIYVLTSLFILVFFELFFSIISEIFFVIILTDIPACEYFTTCRYGTWRTILIAQIINTIVIMLFSIFAISAIMSGRRPQYTSPVSQTFVYARQLEQVSTSTSNPSTIIMQ